MINEKILYVSLVYVDTSLMNQRNKPRKTQFYDEYHY